MSDAVEALLAKLAAKSIKMDGLPGGTGQAEFPPEIVAAALKGLGPGPTALMRVLCADDQSSANTLLRELVRVTGETRTAAEARRAGMPDRAPNALCALAIREAITPPICPTCSGRKAVMIGETLYECRACLGSGLSSMTDAQRMARAGLQREEWHRYGDRVYRAAERILRTWRGLGADAVRRNLFDDEAEE